MNQIDAMLQQAIDLHRVGDLPGAVSLYNQLLNLNPDNPTILYLLGDAAIRTGANGLGINLLRNSLALEPRMEGYTALGCAYKFENMPEKAEAAWRAGLAIQPTCELYNNLASLHSDEGRPDLALPLVDKALEMEPGNPNASWNKSLALLTKGEWREGWALHPNRFNPAVQMGSRRRNFNCPDWDGTPGLRLALHGEQGVGDEIMFLSILPEVLARCPELVVEVEPRLMDLVERSFGVPTYGNETALKAHEKPFDASLALADLGSLFRNDDAAFPGTPYLKADPEAVAHWRRQFALQGPGPYIGVAWQGGTKTTRAHQRSVNPVMLKFLQRGTPISLQYGEYAKDVALKSGFAFFEGSDGKSIDQQAAMIEACDIIVTVPQTLVHLSGALGKRCLVLTPLFASWRYGMGDKMPWYGSVELYRQEKAGDWAKPLADIKREIDKLCRENNHVDQ